MLRSIGSGFFIALLLAACQPQTKPSAVQADYDLIIRNGTVYDGSGTAPRQADVGVRGERIVQVGDLAKAHAAREVDAKGLAVAPGFINMLSWAPDSLFVDGRSMSDIKQGVTLEVFGEGESLGPLTPAMRETALKQQSDLKYPITWSGFGEGMETLAAHGIAPNIASFVGATTLRIHEIGYADRAPNAEELARMQELTRTAMREGALGVGSSLIYAPAFYAKTDELIAITKAAGEFGGGYISHMRSEGPRLLQSIDELIRIATEAGVHGEIYHFKAAGRDNWSKQAPAIAKIEGARAQGRDISANMYLYPAGATGLDASMPPWVQEGGLEEWIKRLKDAKIRQRVIREMTTPTDQWENLLLSAGKPENVLLVAFKNPKLKPLTGKTLAEVAKLRGKTPAETAIDLVIEDDSRVGTVYFLMSEDNIRQAAALPWMSFGSDEGSFAPEGDFLKSQPHPRAYGNFARLLGKYVREEKALSLEEAVRRLTSLSAKNLKLRDRGELKAGDYADIVIFDPATIADHATFDRPQQYATGMRDVFVNGVQVLKDGEHTGAKPGQFVRGPGYVSSAR
jgi:N-acyl-D-amino-acid deacylase